MSERDRVTRPEHQPTRGEASRDVVDAAAALGLQEFAFFRLAYRRWFGRQPDEADLERAFAGYMLYGEVPAWVSHLTRAVLDAAAAGTLEATAFGAERYRDRPTAPRHGRLVVAAVAVIWLAFFGALLSALPGPDPDPQPNLCAALPEGHPMAMLLHLAGAGEACRNVSAGRAPDR